MNDPDHDMRSQGRDQRRRAKYAMKYGPDRNDFPMPPISPLTSMPTGRRHHHDGEEHALPLDQRPDMRVNPGMSETEINDRIRRRIALRIKQRNEFLTHLVSYVAVNVMLWGIWLNGMGFPWPIFITVGWGIGMFSHANQVYQNSAAVSARRERTVQAEVQMEKARLGLSGVDYEKPKRMYSEPAAPAATMASPDSQTAHPSTVSQRVRLSDDGELVAVDDDFDSSVSRVDPVSRARHDQDT